MVDLPGGPRVSEVASFVVPEGLPGGGTMTLGDEVAQHMRVRRLASGAGLRLTDGAGRVARATLVGLTRSAAIVDVGAVTEVPAPAPVHLLAPIGDKDRMLWLAEKATELGLTSWRPVLWHRSRSVQPRGEGAGFQAKVRGRMTSAVAQSHGAWLPAVFPDATLDRGLAGLPQDAMRVVLDRAAPPLAEVLRGTSLPVVLALGPEGGLDEDELAKLDRHGFVRAGLGETILRFETAGVVALGTARQVVAP